MKYVRVTKLRPAENAAVPSGDFETYRLGESNPTSLPVNYEAEGWLANPPAVGEKVHILRTSRNGLEAPGNFWTSKVVAVGRHGFATQNSVYLLVELEPPVGVMLPISPIGVCLPEPLVNRMRGGVS